MTALDPAFPISLADSNRAIALGINVRTYIATKVMAAMVNAEWCGSAGNDRINPESAAKAAVEYADALIAELSKS